MIDEYWTFEFYGYHSDDWADGSHKQIVARCDGCCQYRILQKNNYNDLCHICGCRTDEHRRRISTSTRGVPKSPEHRKRIGNGNRGKIVSDETRSNMSKSLKGKKKPPRTKEHRSNLSNSAKGRKMPPMTDDARANRAKSQKGKMMPPHTDEHRQHLSAYHQGIPYDEWEEFITDKQYCEKFDEDCRERARAKYDYRCFICDKPQDQNITKSGKTRKLSVHHVDSNKDQGCDGVEWKLVPLCMRCHPSAHQKQTKSRIEYLLSLERFK